MVDTATHPHFKLVWLDGNRLERQNWQLTWSHFNELFPSEECTGSNMAGFTDANDDFKIRRT